jgi:aryl-alcohol dehydrogenase-like predicted oxidoreductase
LPAESRLHKTADKGPQVNDEYLYKVVDALDEVAKETGKHLPQVALNWLLQRPTVATVIIGARNETQLRQNLAAEGWNLTPAQVAKLDAASKTSAPYPYWHQRQFDVLNPPPVPQ